MKKNKVVIGLVIAVVLITNIRMYFLLNRIKQDVRNINFQIGALDRNINNIESKVSNSVSRLIEEKKWLYNIDYDITDISKDLKNVSINLKWSIRDLKKGTKMYLLYGVANEENNEVEKWNEIEAEDLGDLNYGAQLTLPFQNNYKFKILAKDTENTISQNLTYINFLDRIKGRVDIHPNPMRKSSGENHVNMRFSVEVENQYNLRYWNNDSISIDENLLKIKNVKIRIYSNEKLKKEMEIYKDGQIIDENAEYSEPFKHDRDIKLEKIRYEGNIDYDSLPDSYEVIEVILEDYLGREYIKRSHDM